MLMFGQKDARTRDHDSMFRAVFKKTYSAFDEVSGLVNGCFSFSRCQAR